MPEFSNYVETRDQVADEDVDGTEIGAFSKNGEAVQLNIAQISGRGVTREFDRTYVEELLFDKNEIEGEIHVQDDVINFSVSPAGNLVNQWSVYGQRIQTDGLNPINFTGFAHISNITTGEVLEAGTYQFIFWYSNGIARASVMLPSEEAANLLPLSAPGNFEAASDGADEIDLTWDAVANALSYEIYYSSTEGGTYVLLTTPGAGDTSYSHTGLSEGSTIFYRIRAVGDLVVYNNSAYSTDSATTETLGDVTAPTFTFSPTSGATDPPINQVIILTANEPIRNADGSTLTDANIAAVLRVKQTNVAGSNIAFTATIDAGKTIITITPVTHWGVTQLVYVDIDNVEDVNGNEVASPISSTFTTTDFTYSGAANFLNFGTQLDSVIEGSGINFELEMVVKNQVISGGVTTFMGKFNIGGINWSFLFQSSDDDVTFRWYGGGGSPIGSHRTITWANILTTGEQKVTLKYFGTIDTNNGLDRATLYIDDVLISAGKTLAASGTATWPFGIPANASPLYVGRSLAEVKDIIIRNNSGATVQLNVPIMRNGTDVSGNGRNGTWVTL